jgi:hypothetical protein
MGKRKAKPNKESVSYNGFVTCSVAKGKKTTKRSYGKNNGTSALFEFLAQCIGRMADPYDSPWYIRAFSSVGSVDIESEVTSAPFPVRGTPMIGTLQNGVGKYVELTFLIPGTSVLDGAPINTMALYSTKGRDNPSAYMAFAGLSQTIASLESGENVLVVWRLEFDNAQSA